MKKIKCLHKREIDYLSGGVGLRISNLDQVWKMFKDANKKMKKMGKTIENGGNFLLLSSGILTVGLIALSIAICYNANRR